MYTISMATTFLKTDIPSAAKDETSCDFNTSMSVVCKSSTTMKTTWQFFIKLNTFLYDSKKMKTYIHKKTYNLKSSEKQVFIIVKVQKTTPISRKINDQTVIHSFTATSLRYKLLLIHNINLINIR